MLAVRRASFSRRVARWRMWPVRQVRQVRQVEVRCLHRAELNADNIQGALRGCC
jgi:hypothetical protein